MNLRNLTITFLVAIICANLVLSFIPPKPISTVLALVIGAIVGIAVSRFVVLPAVNRLTAE